VDWVNGGRLDLLLDSAITKINAVDDYVDTEIGAIITDVGAVHTHVGTIDGHITADYTATEKAAIDLLDDAAGGLADIHADVAAIKAETVLIVADTGELQTDWVNGGRLDTILDARASQTSVNTIDTVVDSILVDTSAITLQPGWTPIISTTTTDPVQNTYYTILNEATNGYIYTIAVTNNHATASKVFTLKVTIDGTVLTSGDVTMSALGTYYFYITGTSDIPLSSATESLFFRAASGGPYCYVPYDTSLKVEFRSTSTTWVTGFTGIVRRFIP